MGTTRDKKHWLRQTRSSRQTSDAARDAARHQVGSDTGKVVSHPGAVLPIHFVDAGWRCMYLGVLSAAFGSRHTGFHSPVLTRHPVWSAVRRGHVFAIIENKGNGRVLAYDPNSGHHKTRIHVRSLAV